MFNMLENKNKKISTKSKRGGHKHFKGCLKLGIVLRNSNRRVKAFYVQHRSCKVKLRTYSLNRSVRSARSSAV